MKRLNRVQRIFFEAALLLIMVGIIISMSTFSVSAAGTARVEVAANIRSGPATTYSVVGSAAVGDVYAVYEVRSGWLRIGRGRWVAGWLTNYCIEPQHVCDGLGK